MYKRQSKQATIFDFGMPLGKELDSNNRWVKKSELIPWDIIEGWYSELFKDIFTGNVAKPLRLIWGVLIIQSERRIPDEELVKQISETPCLQYLVVF
ncbi:MAG: hypothetical protein FWG98_14495 [Candidatus Cloacimonetes bacterium]|nr:hypothetical protein [Candidatus Cloacimonadota bacterium]